MYKHIPISSSPFNAETAIFTACFFSVIWIIFAALRYFFTPESERPNNFLWISLSIFGVPALISGAMYILYLISLIQL